MIFYKYYYQLWRYNCIPSYAILCLHLSVIESDQNLKFNTMCISLCFCQGLFWYFKVLSI